MWFMAFALAWMVVVVPLSARDIVVAVCMMFGSALLADGVRIGHIGGIV